MSEIQTVAEYETLTAEALVEHVVREAAGAPICLTSSFQTEDMVALHMLRQHLPDVPVIFLETGYHFKEVIAYRDRMAAEWKLNLINAMPKTTLEEHEKQFGLLYIVQPTECCAIRKVEPLMRHLQPFDWWFTGLRREQSPTRAGLRKVEDHKLPIRKSKMMKEKVSVCWPIGRMDPKVDAYAADGMGFRSCEPVRVARIYEHRLRALHGDPRGEARNRAGADSLGRQEALECGIHTFSEKA